MTKLKPFEILNIVEEYDGTKTAYFKVSKFYMSNEIKQHIQTMESYYNFNPTKVENVELKIFELLEKQGWI
jgi:hypothetical protein